MKCLYKKLISLLIVLAVLLSVSGCGEKPILIEDEDCFEKFMDAISAYDFRTAYGYLSEESTTMPTPKPVPTEEGQITVAVTPDPEPTPLPTTFITSDEFAAKYEAIFEGLGVYSVSWEKLEETISAIEADSSRITSDKLKAFKRNMKKIEEWQDRYMPSEGCVIKLPGGRCYKVVGSFGACNRIMHLLDK